MQQLNLAAISGTVVSWTSSAQHSAMTIQDLKPDPSAEELLLLMEAVARRRDRDAFIRIFGFFAPRVKSYLRGLKADERQAEDLAQEVLLTVWRRAEQYDSRQAALSSWIFTIARNKRIDVLRRERRPEIDPDDPALVPDAPDGPERAYAVRQISLRVREAIDGLPREQAALLRLSYFEELSHSEMAEELSLPLGTVKSRLRLAMSKLRTVLEELE